MIDDPNSRDIDIDVPSIRQSGLITADEIQKEQ